MEINDQNFEEIINSGKPVLVDFWAEWCGPCKMLLPIIDTLSKEYEDKITICKYNVDLNSIMSSKYSIRSIPALLFFKDGKLIDTHVGAAGKSILTKKIESILN